MLELGVEGRGGFGFRAMWERIEQLGGSVGLEGTLGKGTTIGVELPIGSNAEERAP